MRLGNNQRMLLEHLALLSGRRSTAAKLSEGTGLDARAISPEQAAVCLRGMAQRGWVEHDSDGEVRTWTTKWRLTTLGKKIASGTEK